MKTLETKKAPAAIGPYSQAKMVGNFLFASGQIPVDPATGEVAGDKIETQAEQSCKNVGAILEEAGLGYDNVVKTTCFLADMADFAAFNAVYEKYFTSKPARRRCKYPEPACKRRERSYSYCTQRDRRYQGYQN